MNIFVARQPIFTSDKKTYGYELLFRQGLQNAFPGIDGTIATSTVLSNTFLSMGINSITGKKPGFINFTRDLLIKRTPLIFPKKEFIIEILETIEPKDDVLEAIRILKKNGYTIALDDFTFTGKNLQLVALADIIKVDIMATPLRSIALQVEYLRKSEPATLLAEKVETYQEFEQAKRLGFSLFQGFFFARPEIMTNKSIPSFKKHMLDLIAEMEKPDMDATRIAAIIKNDVSTSYKLLRLINSAYFKRAHEIDTIKDAIAYLGQGELKKFICIIAAAGLSQNKPDELIRTAITRARMCEMGNQVIDTGFSPDTLFTFGLFSLLDAMLDLPMTILVPTMAVSRRLSDALLGRNHAINTLLELAICFERGKWNNNPFFMASSLSAKALLSDIYVDAVKMADSLISKST